MSLLRASYAQRFVFFCLDTVRDHHVPGLTLPASGSFPEWHLLSWSVYFLGFSAAMVKSNGQNEQGGEWTGGWGVRVGREHTYMQGCGEAAVL